MTTTAEPQGATEDLAIDGLPDFGPIDVPDAFIGADGLLLNRLIAGASPDTSIGQFNEVIARFDAGISMARPDREWIELSIPPQTGLEAIEALADALAAGPAFVWVEPACKVDVTFNGSGGGGGPLSAADLVDGGVSLRLSPVAADGSVAVTLGFDLACLSFTGTLTQTTAASFTGDCSAEVRELYRSAGGESPLTFGSCIAPFSTREVQGQLVGDVLTARFVHTASGTSTSSALLTVTVQPEE